MNAPYGIRRATPQDAAVIAYHRRRMFEDMGGFHPDRLDDMDAVFNGWVREKLSLGEYLGWLVIHNDDTVVAGAGLWVQEWPPGPISASFQRGVIYNVYTEPEHRRRGLARQLMAVILDWCSAYGLQTIVLHASDEGRPLYESLGFAPTNEMRIDLGD